MTKTIAILTLIGALLYAGYATLGAFERATAARVATIDALTGVTK
jgi:hypothetical protein